MPRSMVQLRHPKVGPPLPTPSTQSGERQLIQGGQGQAEGVNLRAASVPTGFRLWPGTGPLVPAHPAQGTHDCPGKAPRPAPVSGPSPAADVGSPAASLQQEASPPNSPHVPTDSRTAHRLPSSRPLPVSGREDREGSPKSRRESPRSSLS